MKRFFTVVALLTLTRTPMAGAGIAPTCIDSFYLGNFHDSSLQLVGDAAVQAGELKLTANVEDQAGAGWFPTRVHLADHFDTTFTFRITPANGADGFAFVIQHEGFSALGGSGSGLGYDGIANGLAVEFDTFAFGDEFDAGHISVQTNGLNTLTSDDASSLGHVYPEPVFDDGQPHICRIIYVPGTLTIFLDGNQVLSVPVDLQNINGDNLLDDDGCAEIGFTGGTGGVTAEHAIINWSMNDTCAAAFSPDNHNTNVTYAGSAYSTGEGVSVLTPAQEGQAGAVWSMPKLHISDGFNTGFLFLLDGVADGLAFVIQDQSGDALGGSGSDLGYGGITRSLAVEVDTFSFGPPNEFAGPHISVQTNGVNANSADDFYSLAHATIPDCADGLPHELHIFYSPGLLKVLLDGVVYLEVNVDLTNINGDSILDSTGCAYAGFTGGTGAATAVQYVYAWDFGPPQCGTQPCERAVLTWNSRRLHTGAGPLDIPLDPAAVANPAVETRLGGIQEIRMNFDGPVTLADTNAYAVIGQSVIDGEPQAPVPYYATAIESSGNLVSLLFDPGTLPDQTCYTITIYPGLINETPIGDTDVIVRSLVGNTTASGSVNLSDAIYTRQRALAGVAAGDAPQFDVDLSGTIDINDALTVKAQIVEPAHQTLCP